MCGTRLCMMGMSAPRYIKVVALMPIECSLVPRPLTRELPITITWSLQPAAGADDGDEGTAIVLRPLVFAAFLTAAPISTTGILCLCVCWWLTAVCRCGRTCCCDSEWRGRDLGAGTGRWGCDLAGTSLWLDGPSDDVACLPRDTVVNPVSSQSSTAVSKESVMLTSFDLRAVYLSCDS